MPTSSVPSGRVRTHSWVFVYLRSEGTLLMRRSGLLQWDRGWGSGFGIDGGALGDQCLAVTDERRPYDTRLVQLAANVDLDAGGCSSRHARQRNGSLQSGREGTAGDLSLAGIGHEHLLVGAQDAAPLEQEADELALRPARANGFERLPADECALAGLERDGPTEAGLEGMSALVHVTAVEAHARLEAQRIACTQAAGRDTGGVQCAPHPLRFPAGQHDLEAIFARVAGARDKPTVDLASEKRIETQRAGRAGL